MAEATPHRRRRTRTAESTPVWKDIATALLPIVACFLGGATEKWAEGVVVALLGFLLVVNPPRLSFGKLFNTLVVLLLLFAATAFLPARWFFIPGWRDALINDFGLQLPSTLSPQPWITASCLTSLVAGLAWLYYSAAHELDNQSLRRQLRIFAIGVIALAAVSIAFYVAKISPPFWHNQRHFGSFPNRNQTADLFGITAIVILACAHDEIRRRSAGWIFWTAGLAIVVAAIILNFSRAGIVILVAGSAIWVGLLALRSGTTSRIAVGVSAVLVLLTALLIFGGETLARFHLRGDSSAGVSSDFRWLIFRDVIAMIRASPWCGVGLGNFSSVFATFREASLSQNRALHPESDWFWTAAEIGWPSLLVIVAGAGILARRVFPLDQGTNMRLRVAAFVAAVIFAFHGLVDVSGHRVGTAYAGLLLFGLALRRPLNAPRSRSVMVFGRIVGLALIVAGGIWIYAAKNAIPLRGGIGADLERSLASAANKRGDYHATIEDASRGLEWAPLDWQLYFIRAIGKVGAGQPTETAMDDFRRARFLEPASYEVPYQEGVTWILREPVLTITAWREALRRAGPERAVLYSRMLSVAMQLNRAAYDLLQQYAASQPELVLVALERANGHTFDEALDAQLKREPDLRPLTAEQKARLFSLWSERGDLARLLSFVQSEPELLQFAWRGVARGYAAQGDFRGAVELVQRFASPPKLPEVSPNDSLQQLQQRVFSRPNDYGAGFALAQQQLHAGAIDDALFTIRHFTEQPGAPAYFHFLEAEAWAQKTDWERAWNAFVAYDRATAKT